MKGFTWLCFLSYKQLSPLCEELAEIYIEKNPCQHLTCSLPQNVNLGLSTKQQSRRQKRGKLGEGAIGQNHQYDFIAVRLKIGAKVNP